MYCIALSVWIGSASIGHAGVNVWTSNGPQGVWPSYLVVDPTSPSTLYLGTHGGGVFKSTDAGGSWAAASVGLNSNSTPGVASPLSSGSGIGGLALTASNPSIVYAATSAGIFKSIDSAGTWVPMNFGLPDPRWTYFESIVVDQSSPTTVYIGVSGDIDGVFKSTNGGVTWKSAGLRHVAVRALAPDPSNSAILYAVASGNLYKSTNSARRWKNVSAHLPAVPGAPKARRSIWSVAIDPSQPSVLYAGSIVCEENRNGGRCWGLGLPDDVLKSTDGGASWAALGNGQPVSPGLSQPRLLVDPANSSAIYAVTGGRGVFKSTDGGSSWTAVNAGLPLNSDGYIAATTIATNASMPSTLYLGTGTYAAGELFKSTDGGANWAAAHTGLTNTVVSTLAMDPTNPGTLYAGGGTGFSKSTDGGGSWTTIEQPAFAVALDPANPSAVYASASNEIYKSTDAGATWMTATTLVNNSVRSLLVAPSSSTYAATDQGLLRSTDGGASWIALASPSAVPRPINCVTLDPTDAATIFVGMPPLEGCIGQPPNWSCQVFFVGGVFKSTDAGQTWMAINDGMIDPFLGTAPSVDVIKIDPSSPTTLYAGAGCAGLFKSTDGGGHWTRIGFDGDCLSGTLVIDPSNSSTVYAGTDLGVLKSTDGGGSWTAMNPGLISLGISSLLIDPSRPSTLYAGTDGDGVASIQQLCGNGAVDPGEPCDGSAIPSSGGCSSSCELEACFSCTDPSSGCMPITGGVCNLSDTCEAGVCTGAPTAMTLTRVVLRRVGKVDVNGYIDDDDTGGTFRTQLLADNVAFTVTDGETPPGQLTVSLTGCRSDLGGTIRCVSADRSTTAKFAPQRDAPDQYTMSLHAAAFSSAGPLEGPVTVSVRQTNVQRQATLSVCVRSGTVLTCR